MKQSFYLARSSESGELLQRSSFAHEGPSPSITERMEVWRQTWVPIPALHVMSPSPGSALHLRNDGPPPTRLLDGGFPAYKGNEEMEALDKGAHNH